MTFCFPKQNRPPRLVGTAFLLFIVQAIMVAGCSNKKQAD